MNKARLKKGGIILGGIILINVLATLTYSRIDFTQDQRYTLSPAAIKIVNKAKSPIIVDVFLAGEFPSEFRRLQNETRQLLEEFSAENKNIVFNFVDPTAEGGDAQQIAQEFYQLGMTPEQINVLQNGKTSQTIMFPWATAFHQNKTVKIPLLKKKLGDSNEAVVNSSVENLEYAFANAFSKLVTPKKKKIAFMVGNGELPTRNIQDFLKTVQEYYYAAPFTLDSVALNPQRTLGQLQEFDLIIEAKPTQAFTENEKYVLDQYLMNGGKAIWLVDQVAAEKDSLFNATNQLLAFPRELNLKDLFFSYGVRLNPTLVNDLISAPLILSVGEGANAQSNPYPWFYSPLVQPNPNHPIGTNVEAVRFDFAGTIDTLENDLNKTVLLSTSDKVKKEGVPKIIPLSIVEQQPDPSSYGNERYALGVLLEGTFNSTYKNRITPFDISAHKEQSQPTQLVVIADGDVIKNEVTAGKVYELGFDRFTRQTFGNKEFLLNTVNYLLDDTGLIDLRSKEVSIAFLDQDKVEDERLLWQSFNLILPLSLLLIFGIIYTLLRRKKYQRPL
ncbi:gliding motility-associated ABC transporter substrate-binding protein GldG [Gangjinia marincola]|uniref:Gliding motility-associated ABC transporter substrate-binding protein GldG n=1 Tax=Gangjinia marincola TaxID=578463 RepID=A0ABP3XVX9_9FLAO